MSWGFKKINYKQYKRKPSECLAKIVTSPETVDCYNGTRIARVGDMIVVEEGRTMIMKIDRFNARYTEIEESSDESRR